MQISEEEKGKIRANIRHAKSRSKQIGIEAELHGVTKKDIESLLEEPKNVNFTKAEPVSTPKRGRPRKNVENEAPKTAANALNDSLRCDFAPAVVITVCREALENLEKAIKEGEEAIKDMKDQAEELRNFINHK